jgi:hypothetical protein
MDVRDNGSLPPVVFFTLPWHMTVSLKHLSLSHYHFSIFLSTEWLEVWRGIVLEAEA